MKTFIVDAFTAEPFAGNPAGVCLVDADLAPARMLAIAQELNLSETAFVGATDHRDVFRIRFFSPRQEIPLCGHATLASARVVFEVHALQAAHFLNIQDVDLAVEAKADLIEMTLPAYKTQPAETPPALLAALGIESVDNAVFNAETRILLLEIDDTAALAALAPDFQALVRSHDAINGVLVTARSRSDGHDFHSRYFWPWSGTNEDPVTGGTHTFLTEYWSTRLGKTRMRSHQSSRRGGSMEVELVEGKVRVRARAVIVFEGELRSQVR